MLSRYIVLNPVRAQMVRSAKDWKWSSYRATAGFKENEPCLTIDGILSCFSDKKNLAEGNYYEFVQAGKNQPSPWWEYLKNQIYLGTDEFVENMQCKLDPDQSLKDIPKKQKQAPPKPLEYYKLPFNNRQESMVRSEDSITSES